MQYLDNDMDELFNKAGNDYPLRTDVPDFDGLLGKLNPAVNAAPKRNYRKYLLLLLLLPVGYLMNNGLSKKSNSLDKRNLADNVNVINPPAVNPLSEVTSSSFFKAREQAPQVSEKIKEPALNNSEDFLSKTSFTLPKPDYSYAKPIVSFPDLPIDSSASDPEKKQKQKSSVYIGVIAGPDISTVKYQSIKNVGFSIGILGGYKFSKRWSVETGLIYNSKKYYTDGKYFDKTKSGIPSSVYVESLDGSCNMFEVPVSVRYDFSTEKNRFFVTLGATSYFMKKEKYTYDAYASGSYYEGHRSYNNSGNHIFSNMQFSIGYNRQLSNKINLRIEPYIKVPVRDIGIGNMPITSSGIYFSIMQSIR